MFEPHPVSMSPQRSIRVAGGQLRALRIQAELTQEELAARIGYSDRLVRKLESGGPVQYRTLIDFISFFRVAVQPDLQAHHFILRDTPSDDKALAKDGLSIEGECPGQLMARWLSDLFERRELSLVETIVHPDLTLYADGRVQRGRPALERRLKRLFSVVASGHFEIDHILVDTPRVCIYWNAHNASSVRDCAEEAVVGRHVQVTGAMLVVFSDTLIIELRDQWEVHALR